MRGRCNPSQLIDVYARAKQAVRNAGYEDELSWAEQLGDNDYSESAFLREAAWVVLCGGFRESVVRDKFSYISLCFCDWESAELISRKARICVRTAMSVFANEAKLKAIALIARQVNECGINKIKSEIEADPIGRLRQLPYIGGITSQHLAKNLGYSMAKSDRHLLRMSQSFGFRDAQALCEMISELSGDIVQVVDTVLWRANVIGIPLYQSAKSA